MSKPELVVFDMIGTTVQSSDYVPTAFTSAFDEHEIALSSADITAVRGKSKREAIHSLLAAHSGPDVADAQANVVYERFRERLLRCYDEGEVAPIAGAEATFEWCHANAIKVALSTGFDRDLAELLSSKLGWDAHVDALVCNDDVKSGRPAPDLIFCAMRRLDCLEAARVASVGDTLSDLQAGDNAGVGWNIGVLSGAHTREQLEGAPHTVIIDSVANLTRIL